MLKKPKNQAGMQNCCLPQKDRTNSRFSPIADNNQKNQAFFWLGALFFQHLPADRVTHCYFY
jgi:hypothetical protein